MKKQKDYTKDELHESVKLIRDSNIKDSIKKELFNTLIWKISEINGKYDGVEMWSKESIKFKGQKNLYGKELRHDHVVTRESLIRDLLDSNKNINDILNKIKACIVTKEEHDRLNKVNKDINDWDRYKEAKIDFM